MKNLTTTPSAPRRNSRFYASRAAFCLLLPALLPLSVSAAMVTVNDFDHLGSDSVDYIVTIEDDLESGVTAGHFRISYQVDPGSVLTTAKLTGLFFDVGDPLATSDGPFTALNLMLSNETVASCGQDFNTNQVSAGGGCNSTLNLGAGAGLYQGHAWDVGIAWKNNNDLSDGNVQSFEIAALGLTLGDFSSIGIRGQDTSGSGGSAKEFKLIENAPVVPLPASFWLLGSAFASLLALKRRAKA